jgi:hypothetical protein
LDNPAKLQARVAQLPTSARLPGRMLGTRSAREICGIAVGFCFSFALCNCGPLELELDAPRVEANGGSPNVTPKPCDPITETWRHSLGDPEMPWRKTFGDPAVSTVAGVLYLTYDDVVTHEAGFSGSYYFTFYIAFITEVVFHPNFFVVRSESTPNHPALWFTKGHIKLGGKSYGEATFGTFGDFTGQELAGAGASVTIYVKGESEALAVKVDDGIAIYRSGFVTLPVPDTRTIALVGSNYLGVKDGEARLYPFSGCQNLSDAEVQAVYERD